MSHGNMLGNGWSLESGYKLAVRKVLSTYCYGHGDECEDLSEQIPRVLI